MAISVSSIDIWFNIHGRPIANDRRARPDREAAVVTDVFKV